MLDELMNSGLKLPMSELSALRQLARLRSVRGGRPVTLPDLLRPLVTAFLDANRDEVELAMRMADR